MKMPSISTAPSDDIFEPTESFTVLNNDIKPQKNVNIVKPVLRSQHIKPDDFVFNVNLDDEESEPEEAIRRKRKNEPSAHSQTILDPHFSRHLDLKLRRLKEKEIIAERLSRRQKQREPVITVTRINKTESTKPSVINVAYNDEKAANNNGTRIKRSILPAQDKPLFITTVKKGEFLPPPASMASLLGLSSCERLGGAGVPTLVYSYASKPKVVAPTGASTQTSNGSTKGALAALASLAVTAAGLPSRASQAALNYGNLMTDRRIIRGSTTAFHGGGTDGDDVAAAARGVRAAAARRRAVARRRGVGAPGALPGGVARRHEPVQTEPYLEELYDKGSEMEIGIQTDLLLEKLETPLYVSGKNGCDVETQIIPGELFDFEAEVEPVLEVLVGKTIDQAIAECLEEEDLANSKRQIAAAVEAKAQAIASARHRQKYHSRKDKRGQVEDIEEDDESKMEQREIAVSLVRTHLPPLLPELLTSLKDQGYIAEASPEIQETFLPWLMSEVTQEVECMITSRDVLMDIVKEVIETRAELYRAMGEDEIADTTTTTSSNCTDINISETPHKNEEEDG